MFRYARMSAMYDSWFNLRLFYPSDKKGQYHVCVVAAKGKITVSMSYLDVVFTVNIMPIFLWQHTIFKLNS